MPTTYTSIDQYLADVPEPSRSALEHLRQVIRLAAPGAEETIYYQIPTFKFNGLLVGFAFFPKHLGFYALNAGTLKAFEEELKDFSIATSTVRFSPDHPIPDELITRIVQAKIRENDAAALAKAAKKRK